MIDPLGTSKAEDRIGGEKHTTEQEMYEIY